MILILVIAGACRSKPDYELAEWHAVLSRKKAIARASETDVQRVRQSYADALREFCQRYPQHQRAREAYLETELAFARELASRGSYDQAAVFFESALRDDPNSAAIRDELADLTRRRFVTAEALASLHAGTGPAEVAELLGQPLPGWQRTDHKGDKTITSWYYRRADGGVGGVFFMEGRLFAAEYDHSIRLKP